MIDDSEKGWRVFRHSHRKLINKAKRLAMVAKLEIVGNSRKGVANIIIRPSTKNVELLILKFLICPLAPQDN